MNYARLLDIDGNEILGTGNNNIWVYGEDNDSYSWWKTSITIYNKRIDTKNKKVKWYSTTIENCYWGTENGWLSRSGGAMSLNPNNRDTQYSNAHVVRIPYDNRYRNPFKWNLTPDGFTVRAGDLIFKGMVHVNIKDAEGSRVNDILSAYYPDCFVVNEVSDNTEKSDHLLHIRVSGN